MNKELKAIRILRQNNKDDTHLFDDELLDIVEIGIKEKEYLKVECLRQRQDLNELCKVLKILKKRINFKVRESKNKDVHMLVIQNIICVPISQEEYNLLLEVLL